MLLRQYFKWISALFTTLLVSELTLPVKTIDAGPSEASQLLSAVSEFANGVKDNIMEMVTRPSDSFHESEHNQSLPDPMPPSAPVEPPFETPLEPPPQLPQTTSSVAEPTPSFWRKEGTKIIVTLELDLERIPKVDVLLRVFGWLVYWYGILLLGGAWVGSVGRTNWGYVILPAVLGFFGGLGYAFGGWCRSRLSRREPPKVAEKVESVVIVKDAVRRAPAKEFFESRLSQSYMMPSTFQHGIDPRRLRISVPIAAVKPEPAHGANPLMDRIAKKEEDADPLNVPSTFSDSAWRSPTSPASSMHLSDIGLSLPDYDGFQPRQTLPRTSDLPDLVLGSFLSIASPPPPPEPNLPQVSDPWSDYTPDRTDLS